MTPDVLTDASVAGLVSPNVRRRKKKRKLVSICTRLVVPIAFLLIWWRLSNSNWVPQGTLPSPWQALVQIHQMWVGMSLEHNILVSLRRVGEGLAIGGGIGFVVGLFAGLTSLGEELFDGMFQMGRTIPFVALLVLFVAWFGVGESPKIILIALGASYPMYQSTFTGTRNVDRRIVESARSFGLRRLALFRKVIIPMSMPAILTGLRLAMTFSILGLVIAEQINSTAGIGFLLIQAQDYGQFFREFGCVMIYIFLGIAADLIVRVIEAFSLKWRAGVANR